MAWTIINVREVLHCEILMQDDTGFYVGQIIRFYDDAPTYAYNRFCRLGAFSTDIAARQAVEEQRKAFGLLGSGLPTEGSTLE